MCLFLRYVYHHHQPDVLELVRFVMPVGGSLLSSLFACLSCCPVVELQVKAFLRLSSFRARLGWGDN